MFQCAREVKDYDYKRIQLKVAEIDSPVQIPRSNVESKATGCDSREETSLSPTALQDNNNLLSKEPNGIPKSAISGSSSPFFDARAKKNPKEWQKIKMDIDKPKSEVLMLKEKKRKET